MLAAYTPSLYLPGSLARYRQYPRIVRAQIPGTGYRVGKLVWGEQELNLRGSGVPQSYGSYRAVPLRGLGQTPQQALTIADVAARIARDPEGYLSAQGPRIVAALDRYVMGPAIDAAVRKSAPYLMKWVVPPMAVLYVISGLAAWFSYKSLQALTRRGVSVNRRRRRR